jgi:hypothetical protein
MCTAMDILEQTLFAINRNITVACSVFYWEKGLRRGGRGGDLAGKQGRNKGGGLSQEARGDNRGGVDGLGSSRGGGG